MSVPPGVVPRPSLRTIHPRKGNAPMNAAAEDGLSEIMDAATRALAPPIDAILAEGERLGRRRRRRRHAAIATGTAVVVLAGGVGVAAAVHLSRPTYSTDV